MKEHIKFGILYILLALAIGIYIGSQWNTWFPKTMIPVIGKRSSRCACGSPSCYCKAGDTYGSYNL